MVDKFRALYYTYIKSELKEHDKEFFIMKNLEKKPFEECKIELIELGEDIIITSTWQSYPGGPVYGNEEDTENPFPNN